jgi:protein-disulfide isomerase
MLRSLRAAAFLALLPGLTLCVASQQAHAADPVFSPAQRNAIIDIVRQALKSDPSILRDAVTVLNADNETHEAEEQRNAIATQQRQLTANFGDPQAGNPSGDVTVVEFYDPRCPYCRKMLPEIDAMLKKDHGIRLVYKDIPVLGPASTMEARAIVAAQLQGGYQKMQAALMNDPAQPTADMISDIAREIGLDSAKLAHDMESPATSQKIKANLALSHALKITGTPTFVVGDQIIPGMVDVDGLEDAVTQARKHPG